MQTTTHDYTCVRNKYGWQLYTDMPGVSKAANAISKSVTNNVRKAKEQLAKDRRLDPKKLAYEVQAKVRKVMETYADFGARDSEPDGALCAELEKAFGLPEYSVER